MHSAYLLIGSNLGDTLEWLAFARKEIHKRIGKRIEASSIYQTAPWGKTDQPNFLNQALKVKTSLDPYQMLYAVKAIEHLAGRQRGVQWGARTLDIDILLFDDLIIDTKELTIPHPRMSQRRFVLVPMAEIAGRVIHPLFEVDIDTLLADCPDQSEVSILPEG